MVNTEEKKEGKANGTKQYQEWNQKTKRYSLRGNPQQKRKNPANNRSRKDPRIPGLKLPATRNSTFIDNSKLRGSYLGLAIARQTMPNGMLPLTLKSVKVSNGFLYPPRVGNLAR